MEKPQQFNAEAFLWCLPDLNWGHMDFQSIALPTELRHLPCFSEASANLYPFFIFPNKNANFSNCLSFKNSLKYITFAHLLRIN